MMQRYNTSTQGQYCHSCGMFHHHGQSCCYGNNNGSFSMMFSSRQNGDNFEHNNGNCTDYYSSSGVDCTLSLGTPSTRLCEEDEKRRRSTSSGGSSCMSNFWDLLHPKHSSKTAPYNIPTFPTTTSGKSSRAGTGGGGGGDPLLARRCANCDTTSTPLWRNGPRGPKSLCNACGIRFKKEERRSTAVNGGAAPVAADHFPNYNYHNATGNGSWAHNGPPSQRLPCYQNANEIRFIDDVSGDYHQRDVDGGAHGVSFLSWRLNVADRASLVHDFTR